LSEQAQAGPIIRQRIARGMTGAAADLLLDRFLDALVSRSMVERETMNPEPYEMCAPCAST
jgi:hypothetical protein